MSKAIKNKVLHYKDMYKKLIAYRLKNRLPEIFDNEVYQHHHIFPRSIFGQNNKIVLLTTFEHCLAHYYLTKMYKYAGKKDQTKKMAAAYYGLRLDCGYQRDTSSCKQFYARKAKIEKMILSNDSR